MTLPSVGRGMSSICLPVEPLERGQLVGVHHPGAARHLCRPDRRQPHQQRRALHQGSVPQTLRLVQLRLPVLLRYASMG